MKKHMVYLLIGIIILCSEIVEASSQSVMFVSPKTGVQTAYPLADVLRLSFESGSMIVSKTGGMDTNYNLSELRYVSFSEFYTNIPIVRLSDNHQLVVYPNPVTDRFFIKTNSQELAVRNFSFEIFDMHGRIVATWDQKSLNGVISNGVDVSHLLQGIYVCRVKSDDWTKTIKFIKQ